MKKKLNKKTKGFTLVEVIVVLVIIAILAALLVPGLTGYIDKARNQAAIVEGRQVLMAAQTISTEAYGKGTALTTLDSTQIGEVKTLAEVDGTPSDFVLVKGKVSTFKYTTAAGVVVNYDASTAAKFEVAT